MRVGIIERVDHTLAITFVAVVADQTDVVARRQQLGGAVGAAVVNAKDVARVALHLIQHALDVLTLVENRDRNQETHAASSCILAVVGGRASPDKPETRVPHG